MTSENQTCKTVEDVAGLSAQVIQEVEKAIVGKKDLLMNMMASFLSTGGRRADSGDG